MTLVPGALSSQERGCRLNLVVLTEVEFRDLIRYRRMFRCVVGCPSVTALQQLCPLRTDLPRRLVQQVGGAMSRNGRGGR